MTPFDAIKTATPGTVLYFEAVGRSPRDTQQRISTVAKGAKVRIDQRTVMAVTTREPHEHFGPLVRVEILER